MIKANELRIGNLLNYDTSEGDVVVITTDFGTMQWATVDPKGFNLVHSPIPLTEDWLVKLGCIDTIYELKIKAKRKIIQFKFSSKIVATGERCGWYCVKYKHIKYVHQLQNLYFALTGEELEMKGGEND
jgi:hypothetical protein